MSELEKAIRERHSVRNYTPEHIQAEKIVKLNEKIKELNEAGNLHLQLIEDAGSADMRQQRTSIFARSVERGFNNC